MTKAVQSAEQLAAIHDTNPTYQSNFGGLLHNRSLVHEEQGDMSAAKDDLERALQAERAAIQLNPRARVYREFLCNHAMSLARILRKLASSMEVVALAHQQAVAEARALMRDFPEVPGYRTQLLATLYTFAVTVADDDPEQALRLLSEGVDTCATSSIRNTVDASTLFRLCHAYALMVEILKRQGDARLVGTCDQWVRAAQSFAETSNQTNDWQALVAAVEQRTEIRGKHDRIDCLRMACAFAHLGQLDMAREWFEKASDSQPGKDPDEARLEHAVFELLTSNVSTEQPVTAKENQ